MLRNEVTQDQLLEHKETYKTFSLHSSIYPLYLTNYGALFVPYAFCYCFQPRIPKGLKTTPAASEKLNSS